MCPAVAPPHLHREYNCTGESPPRIHSLLGRMPAWCEYEDFEDQYKTNSPRPDTRTLGHIYGRVPEIIHVYTARGNSPPIPSNRVSVWVSGGSNYVYETNKSEREAETEATQDTPFSPVKKSCTSCVSSRCAGVSARKPKTSLRPLPKKPNVDCRVLPLAGQRGQVLRHRGAVRGRRPHCPCCATEARGLDLVAWHATSSGIGSSSLCQNDAARA